jgi:glutamate-1-semialdehyde 2,1-aminomutase
VILGHADSVVSEAVIRPLGDGISFSLPHPVEVEVPEALCEVVPCAEMARFGKNGSDLTAAAVRVAPAFTRRDRVARYGYHGLVYIGSTDRRLGVSLAVSALTLSFP